MIRQYQTKDREFLLNAIENDKFQNVYLYLDIQSYGFFANGISTYLAEQNGIVFSILYLYHGSVQLFRIKEANDELCKEMACFIECGRIKRVSGCVSLIKSICTFLKNKYLVTEGYIMRFIPTVFAMSNVSTFANENDFKEIAKLIIDDPHLGSGYEYVDLYTQLKERFLYDKCENLCIKVDNKIVSHFASYAVGNDFAVLSGMVTHPNYRNRGYGSILVRDLSIHVLTKGKAPILYCYQNEYYSWYEKLGYAAIESSGKLEIKYC